MRTRKIKLIYGPRNFVFLPCRFVSLPVFSFSSPVFLFPFVSLAARRSVIVDVPSRL